MGLDTSHGCWHGAYSAFTRWRNKLAEVAGYEIMPVKYDNGMTMDTPMIDWGHVPEGALMGEWPDVPSDPLFILIAHSDCEGVIRLRDAAPLADRLEQLLPLLNGDGGGHIGNYREKTQAFIDGLRLAVQENEDVDFH